MLPFLKRLNWRFGANGALLTPVTGANCGSNTLPRVGQKVLVDCLERNAWQGKATLAPAWRLDIADESVYPRRSLTTQYHESDLAFVERLLHEEGLFYFFEHTGDAAGTTLGSYTMVIADHNGAFKPNAQASVNFTQPGAVMKVDSIDRWRSETRWSTNAVELRSWDYRAVNDRPVSALDAGDAPTLTSRDTPGAYAYSSREQGQRIAERQVEALAAARQLHVAAGTVRTLSPGTTFTLQGHAQFDGETFAIVRVVHLMHNNLSADLLGGVIKLLGQGAVAAAGDREFKLHALLGAEDISLHAVGTQMGQRPLYRNRLDVLPLSVPYRSSGRDGHGHLLHPRPTVAGQRSAIVVGPVGSVIHTNRDHRIKLQFHWQRGASSHSRLNHPAAASHTGAPADDTSSTCKPFFEICYIELDASFWVGKKFESIAEGGNGVECKKFIQNMQIILRILVKNTLKISDRVERLIMFSKIFFSTLLLFPLNVYAASFDCKKTQSPVEKLICSDPKISSLDEKLARDYKSAMQSSGSNQLIAGQRKWIIEIRNQCLTSDCLINAYDVRDKWLLAYSRPDGSCNFSESDLLKHWKREKEEEGDFEEFLLSTDGHTKYFSSWLHHRPEMMGNWTLEQCDLHIYQSGNQEISFDYKVLGLSKGVLTIKDVDSDRKYRYKIIP